MRAHAPLLGLLLRPGVLWDVFVVTVVAALLPHVVGILPLLVRGEIEAVKDFEVSVQIAQFCWAFLGGVALGTVASFAWQDLTHCRLSWLLPGLRSKMRRNCFALAACAALAVTTASFSLLPELGVVGGAGLVLVGYGIGNHLWDPHSSRWVSHLSWISTIVLVATADSVLALLRETPELALVGPLVCASSVWQTTRATTVRRRTLVPAHELGASFEDYGRRSAVGPTPRPAARPRAYWRWGGVRAVEHWVRALRYEEHGYANTEVFQKHGLLLGVAQAACFLGGVAEVALPLSALLIVLFQRQDLRRGVVYPISREGRARVVWVAARTQGLNFLGWSMVVHPVLLLAEARINGTGIDWARMRDFSATAVIVAAGLPLLQMVRLHMLEFHHGPVTTLRFGTTLLISSVTFCVGVLWFDSRLREIHSGIHLSLVLVILAVSLLAFRRHLTRWYQSADLA